MDLTTKKPDKVRKSQPKVTFNKKGRFKTGKKLKGVKVEPRKSIQLAYNKPGAIDRAVPDPSRDTAMALSKSILEHTYWLGKAVKEGNKRSAQQEVDAITRFSTLYLNFASSPSEQPLKFSSADNYPENAKKYKGGKKNQYESDEADTDN